MPQVILPRSFVEVLQQFRCVFTEASFDNFVVLVAGFVHALGYRRLTDALRAAGPSANKHYSAYYRFFSHAPWTLDAQGLLLLGLLLKLNTYIRLQLVLDDVLCHRSGKNVALAGMHADPLLKKGKGRTHTSYGHVFVVLAAHLSIPSLSETGWSLPLFFRLYEPKSSGGRKDSPSQQRRAKQRRQAGKPTRNRTRRSDSEGTTHRPKTVLGAEMIRMVARNFPRQAFVVSADHLYNCRNVLHEVISEVNNVSFVTRGRKDAELYELPPQRKPGTKGRPRVRGARLASPQQWALAHPEAFEEVVVPMYGRQVRLSVASFTAMAYKALPGRLLRYIIVVDPDGIYKTDYFLSTDPEMPLVEVLQRYSFRWTIERTFQECKQILRVESTQTQLPSAVRRAVPFGMLLYSYIILWYIQEGHRTAIRRRDPWYQPTTRHSFTDMLAALRRQSWLEAFATASQAPLPTDFADYVVQVVAAA